MVGTPQEGRRFNVAVSAFSFSPFAIFSEDRLRLGTVNDENFVFSLPLLSPFTIFSEDRMRLGTVNDENFVFSLPLLSPFTIFSEDRMRLGIANG